MRVIIPCGGDGTRWNNYMGIPKPLIKIDGETILQRTIRLCRQYTNDIWGIVSDNDLIHEAFSEEGVSTDPGKTFKIPVGTDKVMCSEDLWLDDQDTVILFGDTYFSTESIETILGGDIDLPLVFFGRLEPSNLTRKRAPEIYAVRLRPDGRSILQAECEQIRQLKTPGPQYVFYKIDRLKNVLDTLGHEYLKVVDDFTEDFDSPKDLLNWNKGRGGRIDTWADVDIVIPAITSIPERAASLSQLQTDLEAQCPGATIHVIEQTYSNPPDWFDIYNQIVEGTKNIFKDWVLFFEDDAQIAPDFGERALKTLKNVNSDCDVISFFSLDEDDGKGARMYRASNFGFSQGLAIRGETAREWFKTSWITKREALLQPDIALRNLCNATGRRIMVRLPNLVQHREVPSVLSPSRPSGKYPVSKTFGKPDNA